MIKLILTIISTCLIGLSFGQTNDTIKVKKDTFSNYDELREKQYKAKVETLTYLDSTFNFKVKVPEWLHLYETGSEFVWGGSLPVVKGIENVIVIKCFDKKEFKSLNQFKEYVVEGLSFGKSPSWSKSHTFMGKKVLGKFKNIGDTYKVYFMLDKLIYHCEYVLLETPTAYLWVDFTSTEETFDLNIHKFEEFLTGLEVTNFKR
jgi:hypothetical protein